MVLRLPVRFGEFALDISASCEVPLSDGDDLRIGSVLVRFRQQAGPRSTMTLMSASVRQCLSAAAPRSS
jgi:hypothetical protein